LLCRHDDVDALEKGSAMLDAIYIATGIAFFVIGALYALVCDRL
jgi:hypothetical protein